MVILKGGKGMAKNANLPEEAVTYRIFPEKLEEAVRHAAKYKTTSELVMLTGLTTEQVVGIREHGAGFSNYSYLLFNRLMNSGLFDLNDVLVSFDKDGRRIN